ncbi:MAG: ATP-binding cassette domain-containing protein [Alphaproteobacteria bacterium]
MAELLRLEKISKTLGHWRILSSVNMTVHAGESHVLLGDVGAGKTHLMDIISGRSQPDAGHIYWQGRDMMAKGAIKNMLIGDSKQKDNIVKLGAKSGNQLPEVRHHRLSGVKQFYRNIFYPIGRQRQEAMNLALLENGPGLLSHANFIENMAIIYGMPLYRKTHDILLRVNGIMAGYGFHFLTNVPIRELTLNEKLEANMVRCFFNNPTMLLINNLGDRLLAYGKNKFFRLMREWQKQAGGTIIYSTDMIDDALKIADEITLLKQGRRVIDFDPKKKNKKQITVMLNDGKREKRNISHIEDGKNLLVLDNMNYEASKESKGVNLSNINFSLRMGEVIGIVSLPDNGDKELFSVLRGDVAVRAASIKWHDKEFIGDSDIVARRKKHIGFISKDWRQAVLRDLDVFDNLLNLFVARPQGQRFGIINKNYISGIAENIIKKYDLPIQNHRQLLRELSDIDLHKFVIVRELALIPEIFILREPYVGVNKKTILFIQQMIEGLIEKGAGVVVMSQDVEEIFSICDTVYVLANGLLSPPYEVKTQNKDFIESLMVSYATESMGGYSGSHRIHHKTKRHGYDKHQ